MDGILVVNKPYGITSRDVVNEISKKLKTRKVGHTGTLDPIAIGVLIICVGRATKLVNKLTSSYKIYEAKVKLGILTDTLDNTGNIIRKEECNVTKEQIIDALNGFKGKYIQEVPIYSAVKVNGKKLYEYAREGIDVVLPKREVEIKNIELIDDLYILDNKICFDFRCEVSKGTYIRSLINDISNKLDTIGIMIGLNRIKQGNYTIEDAIDIKEVDGTKLISIVDVLNCKKVILNDDIKKKVLNGAKIDNIYDTDEVLFIDNNDAIALYVKDNNETDKLKIEIMFKGGNI